MLMQICLLLWLSFARLAFLSPSAVDAEVAVAAAVRASADCAVPASARADNANAEIVKILVIIILPKPFNAGGATATRIYDYICNR
jgi:hypothetical protein